MSNYQAVLEKAMYCSQSKPKDELFTTVLSIIQDLPDENASPDLVKGLAELYNFFKPKITTKTLTNFQWCSTSMAKKDIRYYLNYVYVSEDKIIASDGHRMHVADNDEGLEDGYYNAEKIKIDVDRRYPDWKRILNKGLYSLDVKTFKDCLAKSEIRIFNGSQKGYIVTLPTGVKNTTVELALKCKDVTQLLSGFESEGKVYFTDNLNGVYFENLGRSAIMMTMRF